MVWWVTPLGQQCLSASNKASAGDQDMTDTAWTGSAKFPADDSSSLTLS